jgi:hypothetical protein
MTTEEVTPDEVRMLQQFRAVAAAQDSGQKMAQQKASISMEDLMQLAKHCRESESLALLVLKDLLEEIHMSVSRGADTVPVWISEPIERRIKILKGD